ncbi:MAG: mannosyltransferase [Simplicispira sp.]|nr:mannosyltransferase [Simplicispira sp.]
MTGQALPWRDRAELWLAAWVKRYYRWFGRPAEDAPSAPAQSYRFGPPAPPGPGVRPIPPIVWAYWTGGAPPPLIARCFANWRRYHPHWTLRILDDASVGTWVGSLPPALTGASATLRADWIRLELLRRHGGVWMDASTLLTAPLDWLQAAHQRSGGDLAAYYLERYTTDPAYPVVENWFLAAPPQSPLVHDLQREFTDTVLPLGGAAYVAHLQRSGEYQELVQGIDLPNYLSMHLALQRVLRSGKAYSVLLWRAEDGPFLYHSLGHWGRTALKVRLLFRRAAAAPPPLIKLRKPDRKRLDLYLARGLYHPSSTLGRYLPADPSP